MNAKEGRDAQYDIDWSPETVISYCSRYDYGGVHFDLLPSLVMFVFPKSKDLRDTFHDCVLSPIFYSTKNTFFLYY